MAVEQHMTAVRPFATATIYVEDSIQGEPVPFRTKLAVNLDGNDESLAVPDGRAVVRLWRNSDHGATDPGSGVLGACTLNLHGPVGGHDTAFSIQVSATAPYYWPKSTMLRLHRAGIDTFGLYIRPLALYCRNCGKRFGFRDTACDSCHLPRTKWPSSLGEE